MITQAIKGWLQKVFAWWPWKQSPLGDDQYVASAIDQESVQETSLWVLSEDETVPQPDVSPYSYRLTGEKRSDSSAQSYAEAPEMPPLLPLIPLGNTSAEPVESPEHAPSSQQRLEFLRYLVQHGLVNEGFERDHADE